MYKFGSTQKKILLVFLGGIALGTSKSSIHYFRTLKAIRNDWKRINQSSFNRSLQKLVEQKLLTKQNLKNGSFKLSLTPQGKLQAKKLSLLGQSIKFKIPKKWDKKWRIVAFDIPEKNKAFRNILRRHLRELYFHKLQNSVFISAYPFEKQILELASLYKADKYIRVITATKIDNDKKLKKKFIKQR